MALSQEELNIIKEMIEMTYEKITDIYGNFFITWDELINAIENDYNQMIEFKKLLKTYCQRQEDNYAEQEIEIDNEKIKITDKKIKYKSLKEKKV